MKLKVILLALFFSLICGVSLAQEGYSTSSVHQNRSNAIMTPDQVVIEEYINYHKHQIPMPNGKEELAFSMDHLWLEGGRVLIQMGIATKDEPSLVDRPPINVCLVIDKSGSMAAENRMGKVKMALHKFVKGLRPWDYVSIVAYDGVARTILPAQKVGDINSLDTIIEQVYPGGSTNLHQGLMIGYAEVKKNFSTEYTNKVILLTDGLTNVGITDPDQIASNSATFNQAGIDISTIGVGHKLNHELLKTISDAGRGANHFIGDNEEDIVKVFEQELQSLLAPIGKKVSLVVNVPEGYKLEKIFGHEYSQTAPNQIQIPLKNINQGLTQVILCEFCPGSEGKVSKNATWKASLNYWSCSLFQNQCLQSRQKPDSQYFSGNEIAKSYAIALMGDDLKKTAEMAQKGKHNQAHSYLEAALAQVKKNYRNSWDRDLQRVEKILEKELTDLKGYFSVSGY